MCFIKNFFGSIYKKDPVNYLKLSSVVNYVSNHFRPSKFQIVFVVQMSLYVNLLVSPIGTFSTTERRQFSTFVFHMSTQSSLLSVRFVTVVAFVFLHAVRKPIYNQKRLGTSCNIIIV